MKQTIMKKKITKLLIGVMMFACVIAVGIGFNPVPAHASMVMTEMTDGGGSGSGGANTTPRYAVTFDFVQHYVVNTSSTVTASGSSTSATVQSHGSATTVSVQMYGNNASGSATMANGGCINSRTVNIAVTADFDYQNLSLTNSGGNVVVSNYSTMLSAEGLTDGIYYFNSHHYNIGGVSGRTYSYYDLDVSFSFVVDCTAPAISGASTSTTGKFVNTSFSVSASDGVSGVDTLYMKNPNGTNWMNCGTQVTVSAGSTNGLYQFYAKDKAGNSSATYYVFYDSTKPYVNLQDSASLLPLNGGATNAAFKAIGNDTGGGVSYLQYKRPSDTA